MKTIDGAMKAIVYDRYGPPEVLHLREIPKPTAKDDEVLIKVLATTASVGDMRARSLIMPPGFGPMARPVFGFFRPRQRILGTELAGVVEAVGKDVRRFKRGDAVFAFPGARMGSYVEYKAMPETAPIALKPANLTFEEAAALSFGGTTALHFLRKANIKRGDRVLVSGASGAVGTAAVQLAKYFGAHVTGVASAGNAELVRSIGADRMIDYAKQDFASMGESYDIIVDTTGTVSFGRCRKVLKKGGRFIPLGGGLVDLLRGPLAALRGKKVIGGVAPSKPEDLLFLAERAKAGDFRPVIDRRYPMAQIVDAHRYLDSGRKKGNVVIAVGAAAAAKGPDIATTHIAA